MKKISAGENAKRGVARSSRPGFFPFFGFSSSAAGASAGASRDRAATTAAALDSTGTLLCRGRPPTILDRRGQGAGGQVLNRALVGQGTIQDLTPLDDP